MVYDTVIILKIVTVIVTENCWIKIVAVYVHGGNSGHDADSDQDCAGDCFGDAVLW